VLLILVTSWLLCNGLSFMKAKPQVILHLMTDACQRPLPVLLTPGPGALEFCLSHSAWS
jgi:hypothetical protein